MSKAWERLLVQIIPRSPLLLGNRSGISNYQETAEVIAGSVIRGAVAEALIQQCLHTNQIANHDDCPDPQNCPYWQLFGGEEPHFGSGYPAGTYGPSWPLPLTARTCKRHKGWTQQKKPGHGIFDALLADFAYELVSDPQFPARTQMQPVLGETWSETWRSRVRVAADHCPVCGEQLTPVKIRRRYYVWQDGPQPVHMLAKPRTVHVGINRARGVAEDALLFTQESLVAEDESGAFFAEIGVPPAKRAALEAALYATFYIGRGRSRGYGEVQISAATASNYPELAARLAGFQTAVSRHLKPYRREDNRVRSSLPGTLFSLTLRAPAILTEWGRPLRAPTAAQLGLPAGTILVRSWARMEQEGGWHSAARLPRRTALATQAGSVFLYFAPDGVDVGELTAVLGRIEEQGIGQERARGFGQVTICAPIHTLRPEKKGGSNESSG